MPLSERAAVLGNGPFALPLLPYLAPDNMQ
jgi:hypothetical protein